MKTPLLLLPLLLLLNGCATWEGLSSGQQAALRGAAKVALSFGLSELSDRVKEVRPYKEKLKALFETTFSKAEPAEVLGEQLKAGVAKVVPPELQAVVLAQLKNSLQDKSVAGPAGKPDFNQRIALKL